MRKRVLTLFLVLLLSSCSPVENNPTPSENPMFEYLNQPEPVIYGADDVEVVLGENFDERDGVEVLDWDDGIITSELDIDGQVDTNEAGMYLVKYRVFDSDNNMTLHLRYVTVKRVFNGEINIFPYGEFRNELDGFRIYQEEDQGHATFDVVDEMLQIELLSVQEGVWYRPRLNTIGLTYNQGTTYKITFDAKADSERLIQVQVGELLDYDPWFDKFDPSVGVFQLTNEWTTFEYEFTMTHNTNNNGHILFEMGDVYGDTSLTTIYMDNIKVFKTE